MEINAQEYPNKSEKIVKRTLYKIVKNCKIMYEELHDDNNSIDELRIQVEFKEDTPEIYYANGYIPSVVTKQNAKDVDATLITMQHTNKAIVYKAIDLKRNLITYSPKNSIRDNAMTTYDAIHHLIQQWDHAKIYSKIFSAVYPSYKVDFQPIVITRNYSKSVLKELIDELKNTVMEENIVPKLLQDKKELQNDFDKIKLDVLESFYNDYVSLTESDENVNFQVLEFQKESSQKYIYVMEVN